MECLPRNRAASRSGKRRSAARCRRRSVCGHERLRPVSPCSERRPRQKDGVGKASDSGPGHWGAAGPQGRRPLPARPRTVRRRPVCRICATSRSCAARAPMRASRRSASRRRSATACSSPPISTASRRSAPTPRSPASSRRCSRCSPPTRCAMSASRSPCASRRRSAEAEDMRRDDRGRVRRPAGAARHAGRARRPARRWCTRRGATTSFSPPRSTSTSPPPRPRPRSA